MRSSLSNPASPSTLNFQGVTVSFILAERDDPITFVVPGNHDTLTERMAAVGKDPSVVARIVRKVRGLSPELCLLTRLAEAMKVTATSGAPPFLSTFWDHIPSKYRPVDPT